MKLEAVNSRMSTSPAIEGLHPKDVSRHNMIEHLTFTSS